MTFRSVVAVAAASWTLTYVLIGLAGLQGCSSSAASNDAGVEREGGSDEGDAARTEPDAGPDGLVGSDAGGNDARGPDASDASDASDAGACGVDFSASGAPPVTGNAVAQPMPAPTGGTIVDGLYYVTSKTLYTGADGGSGSLGPPTLRTAIRFSGGTWSAMSIEPGNPYDSYTGGTYAPNGTSLAMPFTCPTAGASRTDGYSVTSTELRIFSTSLQIVTTLERQ